MGNYLASLRVPGPATHDEDERSHPLYYDWSVPKWSPFRAQQVALGRPDARPLAKGGNLASAAAAAEQNHLPAASRATHNNETNNTDDNNKRGNKGQQAAVASSGSNGAAAPRPAGAAHEQQIRERKSAGGLTSAKLAAKSAIKTVKSAAKEAVRRSFKSALTGTADTKPANADETPPPPPPTNPKTSGGSTSVDANETNGTSHKSSGALKSSAQVGDSIKKEVDSPMRPQTIDSAKHGRIDEQAALKAASNIHTVAAKKTSAP